MESSRTLTILILLVVCLVSGELSAHFKYQSCEQDRWNSEHGLLIKYDKVEHFIGAILLAALLDKMFHFKNPELITLGIGLLWEIKDSFVHKNYIGDPGGFSVKDLIADISGVGLYIGVKLIL